MMQNNSDLNDLSQNSLTSLMDYAYLLWRWAWLIALAAVLAGGAAYFASKRTTPVYQTTTLLLVNNPAAMNTANNTSYIPSDTMTQTYSEMLTNTPVLEQVIKNLNLSMGPAALSGAITVTVHTNTLIIAVSVSDTNPTRAAAIANSIGAVFGDHIRQLQSDQYASTLAGLQQQVDDMSKQIEDTNAQLAQVTDPNLKLELESRLTQYRQLYSNLVTDYEQAHLAEIQTSTSVTQVQPAPVPTSPVSPKTTQNTLLAAVVGLLLAAGVVLAIDALDDTIKNPEAMRQKFGLPILGIISQHAQVEGKPIAQSQPRSPISEAFRTLRTNVTYAAVDRPLRWIMVTSPTPQDGKTTVCANLGVVFAQGGKKTVVVDGDLRRPMEAQRFGLLNAGGLSELFLHPLTSLNGSAQATTLEGLKVVTSGALPPNPAELMASKKMLDILELLTTDNDLVIVDTPPVLSVTDAAALAPGMDGVILVAKPGVTKTSAFKQTVDQLQGVGAKILGVVLNDVEPKSRKYGYYYHRYYSKYSYYYTPEGKKKKRSNSQPDHPSTNKTNKAE